ncbi:MAG: Na+ dependent nucleoside transporter [Bacteroidia bacterium]|nr:Na+ dependent nucleoside transporter [Bacteroidia bacterium]MBT8269547.1 Na+ dependent nucleoside transporter [Bacteroidia bacterium]NNK70032.1 Na+ dependent nucleoside transporter [Flavobacteriaceae bacterium]NNL80167.1 Na+ dependent nucleoside transporter [Flavobacteriaceae bacterium]
MKHFTLALSALVFSLFVSQAQTIEKEWQLNSVYNNSEGIESKDAQGVFKLESGNFSYSIDAYSLGEASGNYLHQNNLLVLYYSQPADSTAHFRIDELTDSTLILSSGQFNLNLESNEIKADVVPIVSKDTQKDIVPSGGFTMNSLFRGMLGMAVLLLISIILSKNRRAINWRTVGFGLLAQLTLAVGVLKVPFIQKSFEFVGKIFVKILDFTMAGTKFLFDSFETGQLESALITFAVTILPTIIFFSALTSVLFYLGIIQKVVKVLAWLLTKLLRISGAESLSVAGNIFLGQTESPLMIKAYLEKMSKSEILLVMIGGMATVAGGVLAAYIGFLGGEDQALRIFYAKHLLTASVMAAPGAIVISKILYPQIEEISSDIEITQENIGSNILDAIANGTSEGLRLAVNVGAMLLVFLAFIAMINFGFGKLGSVTGLNGWIMSSTPYDSLSLEFLLGYTLAPLMWLIGVAKEDMALMGQLLGIKLVASEFVGYIQLADLKDPTGLLHLKYQKSIIMATYMLCGFANFASIGIQIGGIGSLAPGKRKTLSEFGIRALIGGTVASLLSATIAGMIIG